MVLVESQGAHEMYHGRWDGVPMVEVAWQLKLLMQQSVYMVYMAAAGSS